MLELIRPRGVSLSLALPCVRMHVLGDLVNVKPKETSETGHINVDCAENEFGVQIGLGS